MLVELSPYSKSLTALIFPHHDNHTSEISRYLSTIKKKKTKTEAYRREVTYPKSYLAPVDPSILC
jgi:hypothetical protein